MRLKILGPVFLVILFLNVSCTQNDEPGLGPIEFQFSLISDENHDLLDESVNISYLNNEFNTGFPAFSWNGQDISGHFQLTNGSPHAMSYSSGTRGVMHDEIKIVWHTNKYGLVVDYIDIEYQNSEISKIFYNDELVWNYNSKPIFFEVEKEVEKLDADLSTFDPVSEFPFENINPEMDIDYWEVSGFLNGDLLNTYYKSGELACAPENCYDYPGIATNCFSDNMCLQDYCCRLLIYRSMDDFYAIGDMPALLSFLGEIDTPSEALLLVFLNNFEFGNIGAIKPTDKGYQIIAYQLVNDCHPIQYDQFLLEVDKMGNISVLDQAIYHVSVGMCI